MILHSQLEVGEGNGDEGCDNDEDDEDDEEDGVDGVDLVAPHAGKDVVQLYVDGAERQEACTQGASEAAKASWDCNQRLQYDVEAMLADAQLSTNMLYFTVQVERLVTLQGVSANHNIDGCEQQDTHSQMSCLHTTLYQLAKYAAQINGRQEEGTGVFTCHDHLRDSRAVPGQLWDLTWVLVCAAGSVELRPVRSLQHVDDADV